MEGESTSTHCQTVFFIYTKELGLPQFYMKPKSILNIIGSFFGQKGIGFDKYPRFAHQYWLKGKEEDLIREMMNDEVLQFFDVEKEWYVEGINYFMIFYKKDVLLMPEEITDFYNKGLDLLDRLVGK